MHTRSSAIEASLARLGLTLPVPAAPIGVYLPAVTSGKHIYTSGQLPLAEGALIATGRLGAEVSVAEGAVAARQCALNALGAIAAELGDLARVTRVVKVVGFVASTSEFRDQAAVINGASEFLGEVLPGDVGRHARSAVGVAALPLGAPVEIEMVVEFD